MADSSAASSELRRILLTRSFWRLLVGVLACVASQLAAGPAQAEDGGLDPTFIPNPSVSGGVVRDAAELRVGSQSGKYLIGGSFTGYVARYNADGTRDSSFAALALTAAGAGSPIVYTVTELASGKYLVGGQFLNAGGLAPQDYLVRLNTNGTVDSTFDFVTVSNGQSGIVQIASTVELTSGGRLLVGGDFTNADGQNNQDYLTRLNANGSRDTTTPLFAPPTFNNWVRDIALLSTGRYLVGGTFTNVNSEASRDYLVRLNNTNGSLDTGFTPPTLSSTVYSVKEVTGGLYLVGGSFVGVGVTTRDRVARYSTSGAIDTTFVPPPDINGIVRSVSEMATGEYLISGEFTANPDLPWNRVAVLTADTGSLDPLFTPPVNINNFVYDSLSLTVEPNDGKYLIGGSFTSIGGSGPSFLARLRAGELKASYGDATLSPLTYDFVDQSTNGSMTLTFADTRRGSSKGWSVTTQGSDLVWASSGGSTGGVAIPAANLRVTAAGAPAWVNGQPVGANGPFVGSIGSGSLDAPRKTMFADVGGGKGTYTQVNLVTLAVPAGSVPGTYTGTLTVTTSSGP